MGFYTFAAYLEKIGSRKLENGIVFSSSEEDAKQFIFENFLKRWLARGYSLEMFTIDNKTDFISSVLDKYGLFNN